MPRSADDELAQLETDLGRMAEPTMDLAGEAPGRPPAANIRRYALLERLGEGGMGVVYRAYDARLDRKVALKVLRREESAQARVRFRREAQALAKLHHPNVVTVFDAGEVDERPYLAMALVEGSSLRVWLRERPRTWREIAAVFLGAGRGLAAAHAAGLVHRDVKPDNILVDGNGTAQVADFGVVHVVGAEEEIPAGDHATPGTPRYMAPEQKQGSVDARGDQYAFCVSLREALGETQAPAFLRRVVERGTRDDPAARYPDMDALLVDLGRDPTRVWKRVGLAAVVLGAAAALAVSLGVSSSRAEPCTDAAQRLAGIWDDAARARVKSRFLATANPRAADTFDRVARDLDGYARSWIAMRTEACRATSVRGEQSQTLLDLRMACLDRRAGQLRALVAVLAGPNDVVDSALGAVSRLDPLSTCADADALTQAYPPPADPALLAKVQAARRVLDEALALELTYKQAAALEKSEPILAEARRLGYPPLVAEALFRRTGEQMNIDMGTSGEETALAEVVVLAARSRDARLETRAWVTLMRGRLHQGHAPEALALAVGARAALERAGHPPDLVLLVGTAVGFALTEAGKLDEAAATLQEAVTSAERSPDVERLTLASCLNDLGVALRDLGKREEAIAVLERALSIYEERAGPDALPVGGVLINLGVAHQRGSDYAAARRDLERSLAIMEQNLGRENPQVAMVLTNLSVVSLALGDLPGAEAQARRALAIKEKVWGPDNLRLASSLGNLGQVLVTEDRADEALVVARRAVALLEKGRGPRHPDVAEALLFLGDAELAAKRPIEAERAVNRALDIFAENHSPDRRDHLFSVIDVLLARERWEDALAYILRVEALKDVDPLQVARIDFYRAQASWGANRDRPAALALARDVDARLARMGEHGAWRRAAVTAWLAARR